MLQLSGSVMPCASVFVYLRTAVVCLSPRNLKAHDCAVVTILESLVNSHNKSTTLVPGNMPTYCSSILPAISSTFVQILVFGVTGTDAQPTKKFSGAHYYFAEASMHAGRGLCGTRFRRTK